MDVWTDLTLTRSLVIWFGMALFFARLVWYARGKKAELVSLLRVRQDLEQYADEVKAPVLESKKRWKAAALDCLASAVASLQSHCEELDWRVGRKRKGWKM